MFNQVAIFIKGSYGPHNIGDDALMLVVSNLIKDVCPAHEIGIGVKRPGIAESWLPGIKFFNTADSHAIKAKILIYGGGGQFFVFPLTQKRKSNLIHLNKKLINLIRKRPSPREIYSSIFNRKHRKASFRVEAERTAAFCLGVGPFVPDSLGLKLARRILRNCDYLSVRDAESQKICQSWGINDVRKKNDPCYLKDLWMDDEPIPEKENNLMKSIGLVVRHWPHTDKGNRYFDSMVSATHKLRKMGFHAQFISLDKKYDAQLISKLKNQNEVVMIYDSSIAKPGKFMRRVASKFNLIVSARAHGIILSAAFGLPGVCVGIEPKLRNVHLSLPTGTCLWSEPFNPDELVNIITTMLNKFEDYSYNIRKEADKNHEIAKEESRYFFNWLKLAYDSS